MPAEIESRYLVPDRLLFDRLRCLDHLGPFTVVPRGRVRLVDTYLDTPGRALLRQGWACRLRIADGAPFVTLKGPKQTQGAVVSRSEWEVALAARTLAVERWPAGELRDQVQALTGGSALGQVARVRQIRHRATLRDGERLVGELSLDMVTIEEKGLRHRALMLEAELADSGDRSDLERLDVVLVSEFGLAPETRSKLQRALALVERGEQLDADLPQRIPSAPAEVIAARYGADLALAERVAALAERLCDLLGPTVHLSTRGRALLRAAAWLHGVGAGDRKAHLVARDVVLRQPLQGLEPIERQSVAAAISLYRGAITPERVAEAMPAAWCEEKRHEALQVAALLRLAAALGREPQVNISIREARPISAGWRLLLAAANGDAAAVAAAATRAARRSDLWGLISTARLEWAAVQPSDDGEVLTLASPGSLLGLNRWDSLPNAAHKILAHFYQQMLDRELGARQGDDPEELHDMRVATRRLRSAIRLLGPYLSSPHLGPANEGLRTLGRVLGGVRDMDVALLKAEAYAQTLPPNEAAALEGLLTGWRRRRDVARRRMIRYLESQAQARFHARFRALLEDLKRHEPVAPAGKRVGDAAPLLVYLYWQAIRAYEAVLEGAPIELLHLLRIDCKRLRYAIEFFRDVLPAKVAALAPEVVALQDHLGEMRDDAVAAEMISAYLQRPRQRRFHQAALAYRAACEASKVARLEGFPAAWERFNRAKVTRALAALAPQREG